MRLGDIAQTGRGASAPSEGACQQRQANLPPGQPGRDRPGGAARQCRPGDARVTARMSVPARPAGVVIQRGEAMCHYLNINDHGLIGGSDDRRWDGGLVLLSRSAHRACSLPWSAPTTAAISGSRRTSVPDRAGHQRPRDPATGLPAYGFLVDAIRKECLRCRSGTSWRWINSAWPVGPGRSLSQSPARSHAGPGGRTEGGGHDRED